MDSFTKRTLLLACVDTWCTDLMYTPGWAQKGHAFQRGYKQVTLLSNLVCVTTKLAEACPSASIKGTS